MLDGQGGQLREIGPTVHARGPGRHVAEDSGQVEILERAPAEHRRGHLTGDGDHRGLIELRVVQAGQHIRRPGTGDGEARRRTPRQLSVGARGERGGALVADADEADLAAILGPAQRVGEAEVGVADHAEDRVDAMGDESLDEDVGHRPRRPGQVGKSDVRAVGALIDLIGRHGVGEVPGRLARHRVVVIAVPRAAQEALLDRALAERAALVRALVLERPEPCAASSERDGAAVDDDAADPSLVRHV